MPYYKVFVSQFTYTPPPGFVGEAKFTYKITDPWGDNVKVDVTSVVSHHVKRLTYVSPVGIVWDALNVELGTLRTIQKWYE